MDTVLLPRAHERNRDQEEQWVTQHDRECDDTGHGLPAHGYVEQHAEDGDDGQQDPDDDDTKPSACFGGRRVVGRRPVHSKEEYDNRDA